MPTRRKTLRELARGGTFLARRHVERLREPPLAPLDLMYLQFAFSAAKTDEAREAIARAFQVATRGGRPDVDEEDALAKLAEADDWPALLAELERREAERPTLEELLAKAEEQPRPRRRRRG